MAGARRVAHATRPRAAGAARVRVGRGGGVGSRQTVLRASTAEAVDSFGLSMALSGETVVVGACSEGSNATGVNGNQADNSAVASGAAYVFVRDGGGVWSQQAYLKASNTDADDRFGQPVAVFGDTVVVGTRFEASNATGVNGNQADNSAQWPGASYVFGKGGGGWTTDGTFIFGMRGNGNNRFWRYDVGGNSWSNLADTPANVNDGGAVTFVGGDIYAFRGGDKKDFWKF